MNAITTITFERIHRATIVTQKSFKPPYRNHVTASKMPAFAHQDEYSSAKQTALRTFGGAASPVRNDFTQAALDHGNTFEIIANSELRKLPFFISNRYHFDNPMDDGQWSITGTWRHLPSKASFMFSATPDMMITQGLMCLPVEIKCPYHAYIKDIDLSPAFLKPSHWIQLMAQAILLGADHGYLFVFIPEKPNRPTQYILWRVSVTRAATDFILSLVHEVYCRLGTCDSMESYKIFNAKRGEKDNVKQFILNELKDNATIVAKQINNG